MDAHSIPATSGIYRIRCIVTSRIYVGSAVNLRKRCAEHFNALHRNGHYNLKLQRAFNKYGANTFIFEIIEFTLLPEMLTAREQYWFRKLRPAFNICPVAGSALGRKHRKETIEQIRLSNLGWKHTDEAKRKMSEANKSRPPQPKTIEKMRLANLGHPMSIETRAKLSDAKRGKPNHRLGCKHSLETREKLRAASTGQHHAPEEFFEHMETYIVTSPDGEVYTVFGLDQFCKKHQIHLSNLVQVAKGKRRHTKGWTARYLETESTA